MRIGSSAPILAIDISTCPGLVSVTTRLVEWVSSSRGQNGLAVTWMFGYQMGDSTGLKIREQIRDQVSKFVNLWLADNGK
jgi:hypothetical protein